MPLYTVISDYEGGTYISQVTAETVGLVPNLWAIQLPPRCILGVGVKSLEKLASRWTQEGDGPVLVRGVRNVWCIGGLLRGKHVLLDIIETNQLREPGHGKH
jgi:hypothetical protein